MPKAAKHMLDWAEVDYNHDNGSIAQLLEIRHETVSRMRTVHAPDKLRGSGRRVLPPVHSTYLHFATESRALIVEMAKGAPTVEQIARVQRALDAVFAVARPVQAAE